MPIWKVAGPFQGLSPLLPVACPPLEPLCSAQRNCETANSMQVDEKTVRRIARLARIKVTDAEAKSLEGELSGILDWVKMLDEVKTDGVEPMTSVEAMALRQREDKVTDGNKADDVTVNAPLTEDHFYVVPKVVE